MKKRARRQMARNAQPPAGVEARYVVALRALFRAAHKAFAGYVLDHPMHQDAINPHSGMLGSIEVEIIRQIPSKAGPLFDKMAKPVTAKRVRETLVPVTPNAAMIRDVVVNARDANIRLVEDAMRDYAQDVRDIFDDPASFGLAREELSDQLLARGRVSESRAELIARDQTLKLNGAINEAQQTSAGVTSYIWSTSHDDRVRPEHAELDGQTFDWSSPPEPGHPGEDYQCRCVALPVMTEFDGI